MLTEKPDGLIITISQKMLKEKGVRNWTRNFLHAMGQEDWLYYMRQGAVPKHEVMYVYLLIGGRIRYRANCVMYEGKGEKTFSDGKSLSGRAWIILCGPVVKPDEHFPMKGFQGFRYTQKLF